MYIRDLILKGNFLEKEYASIERSYSSEGIRRIFSIKVCYPFLGMLSENFQDSFCPFIIHVQIK